MYAKLRKGSGSSTSRGIRLWIEDDSKFDWKDYLSLANT
jgi:hypothetical protein